MGTSHSPHRSATGVTLHTRDRTPGRATEVLPGVVVKVGLRIEDRKLVKERKLRAIHERVCLQVAVQRNVCPGGTF